MLRMVLVIHDAKSLAKAEYDKFMCSLNWTLDEQLPGIIDEYESHRKGVCSGLEPAKGQATVETDGKVGAVTKENSVQPKRKTREDVRTKVANTTGPKDAWEKLENHSLRRSQRLAGLALKRKRDSREEESNRISRVEAPGTKW